MTDRMELDELAAELADFAEPAREAARQPVEERVIAGFEEIQRWVAEHGRSPLHGENLDIFERLYAVRLDRIRLQHALRSIVAPIDHRGLLTGGSIPKTDPSMLTDEELAAELDGIGEVATDLTSLRHVRPRAEILAAEDIASRKPCADFGRFKPLFEKAQHEIKAGVRTVLPFNKDVGFNTDARIRVGDFFILGGQFVYVAEMGELYQTPEGAPQARLRVIFGNATESNLLIRSLQNALYKDTAGRRVTDTNDGPLFAAAEDVDR